jgi:hypothetical protein
MLANLGTVVSIIYGVGKLVWWLAKLESRVQAIETEHVKDIDAAHIAIRELRKEVQTQ